MKKQLLGIILSLTPLVATVAEPVQACSIRAGDYNLPACPSNKRKRVEYKVHNAGNFTIIYYIANKKYVLEPGYTYTHTRRTASTGQAITFDNIAGNGRMDKTYVWVNLKRRDKVIVKYVNNRFTSRIVNY